MENDKTKGSRACEMALNDTIDTISRSHGYDHLDLSVFLKELSNLKEVKYQLIYLEVKKFLDLVISKDLISSKSREDYFVQTHKICLDKFLNDKLKTSFEKMTTFESLPCRSKKFCISMFLQDFFGKLMVELRIGVDEAVLKSTKKKEKEDKLRSELDLPSTDKYENNSPKELLDTLHYVSGFVLRRLSAKKCPTTIIKALLKDKNCDSSTGSVIEDYETWTVSLDRGKLMFPTNECFNLFKEIKAYCDSFYTYNVSKLRNAKIKELAKKGILEDPQLTNKWENLTNGEDKNNNWFSKVVDIFLNTRGKVLVKDVKEEFQFITKESMRRKLALRKALKENSKPEKANSKLKTIPGKENSPIKKMLKLSSQTTSTNNSDFSFLNGDPDADLFLQYM